MSRLDALLDRHPLPTWRLATWPVMTLMTTLLLWARFAELDEVAVAPGEVVPEGKVKVVQHLEGSIIDKIYVGEGDAVRTGNPLVRLNLATAGVNRNELLARLDGEALRRARLLAEVGSQQLELPADAARRQPSLAEAQRQAFEARHRELDSSLGVLREQLKRRELEVHELETRKGSATKNRELVRERLKMSESLLSEGLTAKMDHLQLQADVENLEGELKRLGQAIPRARAAVAEARQRLKESEDRFLREAREQLGEVEQSIARLNEMVAQADEQGGRAEIKSPIDGVVKGMRTHTIGGVVSPGEPILEIVPTGDTLVIEAKLRPIDRG